ncbi:DUF3820 family protein [Neptunomonas japonica]|uniref:Cytoplasmic protein n=1 Tax=Neptunomonas japonica JAMM 1380 TaxID=1441457 RepID=A0A7R6PLS0_9GAMM|nr:DUF3820 family protein [Neptunomonas japonica]BBB30536.1 conserved hypothetical protein [Neptunomonas japonica JAMM 1380]
MMSFQPQQLKKLATMKMPFGKYAGRILVDLPEPYICWFEKKGFPSGELGDLLRTLYEIKLNGLEYLLQPLKEPSSRHEGFSSEKKL